MDTTLRLVDPDQCLATIRPAVKPSKSARFQAGELTRTIPPKTAQESLAPITVRELAAGVAKAHGLGVSTKAAMEQLLNNVRTAVSKPRDGVIREEVGGTYGWRTAEARPLR